MSTSHNIEFGIDFNAPTAKNKFIITGGPGFGITTVINELKQLGYQTVREAARYIIEKEVLKNERIFPWTHREIFDDRLLIQKIEDYSSLNNNNTIFFDRGIPDFLGWRRYLNLTTSRFENSIKNHPYERKVFITVPWMEIYEKNNLRPLTFDQAKEIHEFLYENYSILNYNVIRLPKGTPNERANFIIHNLKG